MININLTCGRFSTTENCDVHRATRNEMPHPAKQNVNKAILNTSCSKSLPGFNPHCLKDDRSVLSPNV